MQVCLKIAQKCKCFLTIKIDVILEADICEQQGLDRYKCYGRAKIKAFSLSTAEFCHFCFLLENQSPRCCCCDLFYRKSSYFIEYNLSSCLCEQNVHRIVTLTPMPRIWTNFHHSLFCSHWSRLKCVKHKFCRFLCLMNG